jgi:hypothetical protein
MYCPFDFIHDYWYANVSYSYVYIVLYLVVELELMSNPAGCFIFLAENYRLFDMIEEYQYCIALDLYETRLPWEGPRIWSYQPN